MADMIYIASITHKHGTDIYPHRTQIGAYGSVADFARSWWNDRAHRSVESPDGLTEAEVIYFYFDGNEEEFYTVETSPLYD